jgi:hypothetical protein
MAKRRCKAKAKTGRRCRAAPLRGRDTCIAHTRKDEISLDFGGRQPGAGRPRKPKPSEELRRIVDAEARAIVRPFFAAIGVDVHDDGTTSPCRGAMLVGRHEGQLVESDIEDLGARMAAARELLDRVYGRPRQQLEVAGVDDGPIELETTGLNLSSFTNEELELLQRAYERSGSTNGHG